MPFAHILLFLSSINSSDYSQFLTFGFSINYVKCLSNCDKPNPLYCQTWLRWGGNDWRAPCWSLNSPLWTHVVDLAAFWNSMNFQGNMHVPRGFHNRKFAIFFKLCLIFSEWIWTHIVYIYVKLKYSFSFFLVLRKQQFKRTHEQPGAAGVPFRVHSSHIIAWARGQKAGRSLMNGIFPVKDPSVPS